MTRSLHRERPVLEDRTDFPWDDDQRTTSSGPVVAHFGDLTDRAVRFIESSSAVVGCVAWLTEPRLLAALAGRDTSIVVQKEDFLRPDARSAADWATRLRASYAELHNSFVRFQFPEPLGSSSYATDPTLEPVRCVGNHNSDKSPAMPRMHHKFLVRLEYNERAEPAVDHLRPVAVWTGSFNFSKNAGYSFENAVEIDDSSIAAAYFAEFARVMSLSEPLEWESPWVYPEWRTGT
ncbi:hypothetical protein [Microbacterium sp. S1037]|uniref:hypothetical protein n=1 Tax=Microbacterium sp. S1037 TaxID=3398227 RepID=UPI003AAC43AC